MGQILIDIVPVGVQQQWLFGRIQTQVGIFDCYFSIGTIWHLPLELKDLKDVC